MIRYRGRTADTVPDGGPTSPAAEQGWALVDLLLAAALLGGLTTILYSSAIASFQALRVREVVDELDENARIALEVIARDVRDSGYGAATGPSLRGAGTTWIRLACDLDLDGETGTTGERVAYLLDEESRQLRRQAGDAAPQPMLNDVEIIAELFRFRDAVGDEILPAGDAPLSAAQLAAVRQIDITLRLAAAHPVAGTDRIHVQHRFSVGLRNASL